MESSLIRCVAQLACVLAFLAPSSNGQTKARDKTVGSCTRKEEFAKKQALIDIRISELVKATEDEKEELGIAIATDFGCTGSIENLIRYRHAAMRHVFTPLLETEEWPIVARALYGLKMTGAAAAIPAVVGCLEHRNARVREMAANCLSHLAVTPIAELDEALKIEKDPFVRSSLKASIATLSKKEKPYAAWKETLVGPKEAPRVKWAWTVKGKRSFNKYDAKTIESPKAESLAWPISWYHDSLFIPVPRSSFGGKSGHAGEDMAWFREGCSVYAIGNGIVRMIQGAGGNWGFLALIEHRLANGDYACSLYGHLAWDLLVKPGDVIRKGQKIGTVGLSCSVENGGYGAHLHFGIADNPFRKPRGIYRDGSALNFTMAGKRVRAAVVGYTYMPDKPDKNGFPGLGLRAKLPDGKILTVSVGNVPMASQVDWIKGYAKRTRGWFKPSDFIEARLAGR